jgi:hypothetical protein
MFAKLFKGIAYLLIWFFAFVMVDMAYKGAGLRGVAYLLAAYWGLYLMGLWLEKPRLANSAWAMLFGFAFGAIRLLDVFIPNQAQATAWLRHVPKQIIGIAGWAFILIFIGVLPVIAEKIIAAHQAKNRVLGRD